MKKIFCTITILSCCMFCLSQTIIEDRIDDFTKNKVKRTSWEKFSWNQTLMGYIQLEKINNLFYLNFRFFTHNVTSVRKDASFMLMTNTDSVITILNQEYQISCTGCVNIGTFGSSGQGIDLTFPIDLMQIEYLKKNEVKKFRIYTSDGYIESETKDKYLDNFLLQLKLITQ